MVPSLMKLYVHCRCTSPHAVPWLCRAAAVPGARLHADTPRGPPLLTGLNPTVYWCTNQPSPVRREWEGQRFQRIHSDHQVLPTSASVIYMRLDRWFLFLYPSDFVCRYSWKYSSVFTNTFMCELVCASKTQCSPTLAIFWLDQI